ncbi:MAG TPA: serine peptidase, partial [Variovorax sp.]|nr:serine peptidase [Variovorax sp.]
MLFKAEGKRLRTYALATAFALGALGFVPTSPALAQSRSLPDFTDLVDQVGPSVVNIRTVERVS